MAGIAEAIGAPGQEGPLAVAIDKLDKIGRDKVLDELRERGFSEDAIDRLEPMFAPTGESLETLGELKVWLADSPLAQQGIAELEEVWKTVGILGLQNSRLELDVTLARGLSYYTGAIFEVKANLVQIGSVSGGGRYDNLTGAFGHPGLSGVGISFGVDRIYDVMEELKLFPATAHQSTKVLIVCFDAEARVVGLPLLSRLRAAGISAEAYPDLTKVKKQLDYANARQIPYVVLIGSEEIQTGQLSVKNMITGEQQKLTAEELLELF